MERFFRNLGRSVAKFSRKQKTYRFAVYGRAASGKTCILAALAMKCIAHPSKYTSTWILEPVGVPRPAGDPESWDLQAPESAFHLGKLWLEKAIERLSKGELPPPNPHRPEPLRYLYHFTTPDHRTYPVELIDYSGELIDPAITNDEMAVRLREHIREMDGILVLAEVPHPTDDSVHPITNELHKLEQAFAILKNESKHGPTLDIPLALLINKWDRRSKLRYTTPENEYKELLQFLESKPEPPHKALVDALRYSVPPENFKVFPVSAFGEHEFVPTQDKTMIERPKSVSPMRPFGLEDGFIWAAQRRDAIDITGYEEEVSEKSSWCFFKNATVIPSLPLIHKGRLLAARFAKNSPERKKIQKSLRHFSLTMLTNALCFMVIAFCVFLVTEVAYDSYKHRSILSAIDDPQTTVNVLKDSEDWLASYYRAPFYRHPLSRVFVVERQKALDMLQNLRDRREEMLWQPVLETGDEILQVELARKYLRYFGENGKYRDIAYRLVTEAEQAQKYLENQIHIDNIRTNYEAMLLKGSQTDPGLNALYETLKAMPFPEALTDELIEQQSKLLASISQEKIRLAKSLGKEKWLAGHEDYRAAMRSGDVSKAVDHLIRLQDQTLHAGETAKLLKDFKKRVVAVLKQQVDQKTKKRLWQQSRNIVQKALDDKQLLSVLSAKNIKQLQNMLIKIDIAEDSDLYAQVIKYKDREHVDQYLKYAPLQKMKTIVKRYQQHLHRLSGPLSLHLEIANITWKGSCSKSDMIITYNGKSIIEKTNFKPPKSGKAVKVGSTKFQTKLNDIAKIYAKISCDSWWSEEKTGDATWEGIVGDLNGLRLALDREDKSASYITFTLTGIPQEPLLPAWGS